MIQFKVTAVQLDNFANYCDQAVQQIQSDVALLHNQIVELLAVYKGPAANQLQVDMESLRGESLKMQAAMNDIVAVLHSNARTYVNGETQNVTNLRAATAAINAHV
jgi:WXG100 family type VII secretion target